MSTFEFKCYLGVSSLGGIVLLAVVLERGMFYEQFRCSIIIDGKTFEAVIDVHKVKGR